MGGIQKVYLVFIWMSENSLMERDIFNTLLNSAIIISELNTEHPELIFPSCVPVICPQIELTPSARRNLSRDKVTLETFRQLTAPQIGTWVKTIKTQNIQAEKKKISRERRRDLFCSKLTQTIKKQNPATVTSQEIFVVKSKEIKLFFAKLFLLTCVYSSKSN